MAVPASIIQSNLRKGNRPLRVELSDLGWIDSHDMGADIPREFGWVSPGRFYQPRHMAFDTSHSVKLVILVFLLLEVAILAGGAGCWFTRLAQLDDPGVRIVAVNTLQYQVFALVQFFILLMMLDETIFSIDRLHLTSPVAFTTGLGVADYFHVDAARVADV